MCSGLLQKCNQTCFLPTYLDHLRVGWTEGEPSQQTRRGVVSGVHEPWLIFACFKFIVIVCSQNNTPDQTTASPQTNDAESKDATEDVAVKEVKNTDAPMES